MSNVKIILLGDATEGLKYAPTAMWYAKKMRIDGLGHGMSRVLPLADGVMLRVNLDDNTGDKAYIEAGGACPVINTNSFLDTFKARVRPPGHTPRYLINKQLAEELREVIVPPATAPSPKLSFIRTVADPDTKTLTVRLPVEATLTETVNEYGEVLDPPQKTVDYSLFKETYDRLLPTKFTGLMRRVVQATMATDAWRGFAPTPPAPALAPINYQYGSSWGCIKHIGADGKIKYYFIEIGVQSVYYVPADYCVHRVKVKGVDTDAIILRSADVANKVKIGEIPSGLGESWDNEVGWAFSYDKTEASIVLHSTTTAMNVLGFNQDYVTVSLLTLTFTFSAAGAPIGMSLAKTTPQIFYNNALMDRDRGAGGSIVGTGMFHVPTLALDLGGNSVRMNKTVNFGRPGLFVSSGDIPVGYAVDKIPVYVYYTEAGMQVCEYSHKTVATRTDTTVAAVAPVVLGASNWANGVEAPDYLGFSDKSALFQQNYVGTKSEGGYVDWGFSVNGSSKPAASGAKNHSYYRYQIGERLGKSRDGRARSETWHCTLRKVNPAPPPDTFDYPNEIYSAGFVDKHILTKETVTESGGGSIVGAALTLPVTDTECALVFTSNARLAETTTIDIQAGEATHLSTTSPLLYYSFFRASASESADDANTYQFCGQGASVVDLYNYEYPRTSMRSAATGDPVSDAWSSGGTFSGGGWVMWDNPIAATQNSISGGCVISYTDWQSGGTVFVAGGSTTDTKPATTVVTLTLYNHNAPMQMTQGNNLSQLTRVHHPGPANEYPLAYIFMQAAFDPSNYVMHEGDLNSALVVKFQGKTYDVEHTKNASPGLFGFLGAV